MTFSQNVKNEIIKNLRNADECCAYSFLRAVIKSAGFLSLKRGELFFAVESDNVELLTLCKNLVSKYLFVDCNLKSCNVNAKGVTVYCCEFPEEAGEKLGLIGRSEEGTLEVTQDADFIPKKPCCKRSFMQGLFVSCGSVVTPSNNVYDGKKQTYHLELRFTDGGFANCVAESYSDAGFRQTERKSYKVLYLKESEKIADYLVSVNAMANRLQLEKIIIERSVRNDANRQSNCIAANIGKSVDASAWQIEAIRILKEKKLFDTLPEKLKEIAAIREEYPEATLDEIAKRLGISKSGANHRFTKLKELSES